MRGGLIKAKKILCPTQNLFGLQAELLLLSHKAEKKKKYNIQDQPNFKRGLEEVKKKNQHGYLQTHRERAHKTGPIGFLSTKVTFFLGLN